MVESLPKSVTSKNNRKTESEPLNQKNDVMYLYKDDTIFIEGSHIRALTEENRNGFFRDVKSILVKYKLIRDQNEEGRENDGTVAKRPKLDNAGQPTEFHRVAEKEDKLVGNEEPIFANEENSESSDDRTGQSQNLDTKETRNVLNNVLLPRNVENVPDCFRTTQNFKKRKAGSKPIPPVPVPMDFSQVTKLLEKIAENEKKNKRNEAFYNLIRNTIEKRNERMRPKVNDDDVIDLDDSDDDSYDEPTREDELKRIDMLKFVSLNNKATILYLGEMTPLLRAAFLNDTVISWMLTNSIAKLPERQKNNIRVFDTQLFSRITGNGEGWLQNSICPKENRWTMSLQCLNEAPWEHDVFQKKMIVIPIFAHQHWMISIIIHPEGLLRGSKKKCHIFFFDPQWSKVVNPERRTQQVHVIIGSLLTAQLTLTQNQSKFSFSNLNLETTVIEGHPEQQNGHDCGIFIVFYFKRIMKFYDYILAHENPETISWRELANLEQDNLIHGAPREEVIKEIMKNVDNNRRAAFEEYRRDHLRPRRA